MPADSQLRNPAVTETAALDREQFVQQTLLRLVQKYGRGIYDEPARCEAMLRDLCPECRREIFLVVAALKERVVSDLMLFGGATPDDVLVARNTRRLQDGLGLSEVSARWAVESWLPPAQLLAAMPPEPVRVPLRPPSETFEITSPDCHPDRGKVDWRWLALCFGAILCSCVAAAAIAYYSLYHGWQSLVDWAGETVTFGGALALAGFGLSEVGRRLRNATAPQHHALDPNRMAAALLAELTTLLLLPLVPVAGVSVWSAEWAVALHIAGRNHDLAFHLGRILQSLLLAVFVYHWVRQMISVQGAIAVSMVRGR